MWGQRSFLLQLKGDEYITGYEDYFNYEDDNEDQLIFLTEYYDGGYLDDYTDGYDVHRDKNYNIDENDSFLDENLDSEDGIDYLDGYYYDGCYYGQFVYCIDDMDDYDDQDYLSYNKHAVRGRNLWLRG